MLQSYWLSLRLIANDVVRLYQHFWHWNLSKIVILVVTLTMAIVVSIPFLGAIWFLLSGMVNNLGAESIQDILITGTISEDMLNALMSNYWALGAIIFCAASIFVILTSMMTYGYYLSSRVYKSYLDGTPLSVLKNDYFSIPHILKFLGILGWSSLYLMIPLLCGMVGLGILMFLTNSGLIVSKLTIGTLVGILTIAFFAYFIFMAIRVMFSYIMMLESDALSTPAHTLVKRSIALAKGNIPKIISLVLPFAIGIAICGAALQTIKEYRDISVITKAANTAVAENQNAYINDHIFIQNQYLSLSRLNEEEKKDILYINNAFAAKTDGIDPDYLKSIYPYIVVSGTMDSTMDIVWQVGLEFTLFLLVNGVMLMVYISIYHILRATVPETTSLTPAQTSKTEQIAPATSTKIATKQKVASKKSVAKTPTESKKNTPKSVTKSTSKVQAEGQKKSTKKDTKPTPKKKKSITK